MSLILASASPARLHLLKNANYAPDLVFPTDMNEDPIKALFPSYSALDVTRQLSYAKGIFALHRLQSALVKAAQDPNAAVQTTLSDSFLQDAKDPSSQHHLISADTMILFQERVLGKPGSAQAACEMLQSLLGHEHQVISVAWLFSWVGDLTNLNLDAFLASLNEAPASLNEAPAQLIKHKPQHTHFSIAQIKAQSFDATTRIRFRKESPEVLDFIQAYVETGSPLNKAGAYGIQEAGLSLVEGIQGDLAGVIGLPLAGLLDALDLAKRNEAD